MTHLLILFFSTFSAAFMATVPPGLLNMNAAKTSVERGKMDGIIFCVGVSTMIMVQAYISVVISKFLYRNPEVIDILLKLAILVFAIFAVYFFIAAKRKPTGQLKMMHVSKKRSSFFKGTFLAAVNFLTIPYYAGVHAMWTATGLIDFYVWDIIVFMLATGTGTFAVLYLYTVYFYKLDAKTDRFSKNSNYILSVLMLLLLVITLIRIIYT
ncbi:MAG: LysE family transporter [Bacteroidia bacterium]|nr:LysE family transporter [Bacteroidia bacterium]